MTLGYQVVMNINVKLYNFGKDGTPYSYHGQYQYYNDKMNETTNGIRLSFTYHLTIENRLPDNKEYIMIGVNDIQSLINAVNNTGRVFAHKSEVFKETNNRMVVVGAEDYVSLLIGLPMDKWIRLEPTVVVGYEDTLYPGVRMYLNSETNWVDMTEKIFSGFQYHLNNGNLYTWAMQLINYHGKPDHIKITNGATALSGKGGLGSIKSVFQDK